MAIFGGILYLPFKSGTIVFVAVLVVFTVFEGLLHILEVECNKHGLKGLIKKMYREFMILGFISFAILLATELSEFKTNIWYDAFHFAHIVLLFVGFVFLIQSGLLSALVRYRNRALLSHDKSSSEELIVDYVAMHNRGGLMKFLFNFGPISIPVPELREKIEYKIIQEFFVRNYNLPPEFKFANYMCGVLRHYVISLVEVRPISWIILACFVCLNLFRIEVIDPIYARGVCERYPAKNLHLGSHRTLMSLFATDDVQHAEDLAYGRHVCQEYLLRYTFVLLFFITFYVIGVLVASEVYIQRLIGKVLDQEETIEWLENEEQRTQQQALLAQQGQGQGQENSLDTDGYVDLHHLPDDSFAAANPQRSAAEKEKEGTNAALATGGAGIELVKMRATPQTSQESNPSNGAPVGAVSLGPRRTSADELSEFPPTTPVYGAANVRRLTAMHRRNSAKGDDFMNTGLDYAHTPHTPYSPYIASPRRLDGDDKNKPPLALDIESGVSTDASTKANNANATTAELPPPRRLAPHQRMGSLRDEILQIEAESGVRRLQPHHRQGSLRSEVSENFSTKHNKAEETRLVGARNNRRFLYLRCLERIMHVEFDFHANEARRVGQQEQVHSPANWSYANGSTYAALPAASGGEKSAAVSGLPPRRNVRGNSAQQAGGPGAPDLLHPSHTAHASSQPPSTQPRDLIAGYRARTHSNNSSLQDSHNGSGSHNGHAPSHNSDLELMHTDMRSNFRLMKDLRAEMLQEERKANMIAHPTFVPESTSTRSKFFGNLTPNAHSMSFRARSEVPPPIPRLVSTMSMDLELGGPAVRELHQIEIARGIDEDYGVPKEQEKKKKKKSHKKKKKQFSLTYATPGPEGLLNRHSSKTFQERQYEHMSLCDKFFFNLRTGTVNMYHHMLNALMGHHIGEEEPEVDADVADLQEDFTHIFLFRSAEFYYFCVEFSLLAQCVYLALWATNFVFIANDSYYPVLWNIALLVPVPFNFLFTKQIIFTSVMLKSIVTLDKYVADKICEEAVDERNVKHRVRKVVRSALRTLEIPRDDWLQFTRDQFEMYIPENDEGLNIANLKLFLHSLQIFLTDNTVKRIFTVLDFDKDGTLVWEEIMPIVFPELVRKQVKVNKQRRAAASFDFHIEGELVTTEEKKEVQRKSRQQRRASLITDTATNSARNLSLSDAEKCALGVDDNGDGTGDMRIPTPDTTLPTPTPHTTPHAVEEGELKSDVSDCGDESSDSSSNSHDDVSSDEESDDNQQERSRKKGGNNGVQHQHGKKDIDVGLLERVSQHHRSPKNGKRGVRRSDENQKSVNFFDV